MCAAKKVRGNAKRRWRQLWLIVVAAVAACEQAPPAEPPPPKGRLWTIESSYGIPSIAIFAYDEYRRFEGASAQPVFLAVYDNGSVLWSESGKPPFRVAEITPSAVDNVLGELRGSDVWRRAEREPRDILPKPYAYYEVIWIDWQEVGLYVLRDGVFDYDQRFEDAWREIVATLMTLVPDDTAEDESISFRYTRAPSPFGEE